MPWTGLLMLTLLLFIPANILVLYIALAMQNCRLPVLRLLLFGAVAGLGLSLFRLIPGPFGLHMPLQLLLLIGLVRYLSQGRWSMAVLGVLVTQLLTMAGEGIIGVPIMARLGIPLADTFASPWLQLAGGWMGNSLAALLALYLALRNRWPASERRGA